MSNEWDNNLLQRNLKTFNIAQEAWDNRVPPEDGPTDCDRCNGSGKIAMPDPDFPEDTYEEECPECEGHGRFDPDGNPLPKD